MDYFDTMTHYGINANAISEGTFAIRGYGPKSGITDVGFRRQAFPWASLDLETSIWWYACNRCQRRNECLQMHMVIFNISLWCKEKGMLTLRRPYEKDPEKNAISAE